MLPVDQCAIAGADRAGGERKPRHPHSSSGARRPASFATTAFLPERGRELFHGRPADRRAQFDRSSVMEGAITESR
jgi:hypothetical protein